MEYILENVEEYRQATEQLNAKANKWKKEIEVKRSKIEQLKKDLQAEKVLLTDELIEERLEEIEFLEKETIDYQQNRFGPNGDFVLQKKLLIKPIQDQVFTEVQKIGKNKRYDFIFDKSADVVMLFADTRHDLSEIILREIGRTRKISASKKKAEEKKRMKKLEEEGANEPPVLTEAMKERQAATQKIQEDKAAAAAKRREEQEKARAARAKVYEERRKKIISRKEVTKGCRRKKKQKIKN